MISTHAHAASAAFAGEVLRTIVALGIVLVAMVLSLFLVKKLRALPTQNGRLKIIEVLPLGAKERIAIVSVDGQELLIGIAAEQISLLTTMKPTKPMDRAVEPGVDKIITDQSQANSINAQKNDSTT